MKIWLYCIIRNEAKILPYFLKHYTPWVEKLIFYDDQSDDGTREMLQACPQSELRNWPGSHGIVDDEFLIFANEQWKEAKDIADWIIWVDADEFIYHRNITDVLLGYIAAGVDCPLIDGYTMMSDHFPTTDGQIYDEIKTGFKDECWSKQVVFRENIRWNVGRHSLDTMRCQPRMSETAEIKLLHYRCLGMDYLRWRHDRNWQRVPDHCRAKSYGLNCEPGHVGHHSLNWFTSFDRSTLTNVI